MLFYSGNEKCSFLFDILILFLRLNKYQFAEYINSRAVLELMYVIPLLIVTTHTAFFCQMDF